MNCSDWQGLIDAYVDAELSPSEMQAFRLHAEGCTGCAAMALSAAQSKLSVRRAGNRYNASPELRARVFAQVREEAKPQLHEKGRRRFGIFLSEAWPRWTLAAAALVLLALGLFFVTANRRQESTSLAELVDLHVADLASANPVEVVSTDRHTVKPWFQGKIPFTFDVPELQGTPFTLAGGRVTYFHQEPGAQLIFGYQRHMISVFIFRQTSQLALPVSSFADQTSSFRVLTWTQGGLRYVAVGDAGASTIQELADLLHKAQ